MTAVALPETSVAPAPEPTAKRRDFLSTLGIVVGWNIALTLLAWLFLPSSTTSEGIPKTGIGSTLSLLSHTFRWDAGNYAEIAQHAYTGTDIPVRAFYPMFPLCIWLVHTVSFGLIGVLAAGVLVNVVATWLAAVALLKIGRIFFTSERAPWLVVAAFLTAPAAFFLHAYYSEAVFCAFAFWAYLFALRRQWLWMGLCLIPLTASRITAMVFVGLCFLEFLRAADWKPRGLLNWRILWFPGAFAGLGAVLLMMKLQTGSFTSGFTALRGTSTWAYQRLRLNFIDTSWEELKTTYAALTGQTPMSGWTLMSHVLPMLGVVLLVVASVYFFVALRWDGLPLALFGLASFVMLTINNNVVSVHRYLLPCLVMYLALVLFGERRPKLRGIVHVVLYTNAIVGAGIYLRFIAGYWAG